MAFTKLISVFIIFQSHKNKIWRLIYKFMTTKCVRRQGQRRHLGLKRRHLRASFLGGLKSLGACPTGLRLRSAGFDSTQWGHHMTWRKLTWQVWRGGGGEAMAPLCLVHVLTQRKKMAASWGFSQTLIFFQKDFFFNILGPDTCSTVRSH